MKIIAAALLIWISPFLTAQSPLFEVIKKKSIGPLGVRASRVVYEHNGKYLSASPLVDFNNNDYYFVQLPSNLNFLRWLEKKQIIQLREGREFAILKINTEAELLEVASRLHNEVHSCGMIQKIFNTPIELEKIKMTQVVRQKRPEVTTAVKKISQDRVMKAIETMEAWDTRYHSDSNGVLAGEKLKALYEAAIPSTRQDIELELINHNGSPQKSLVVRIKGAVNPEKIVIVGSHLDSINRKDNTKAPGADDNASGTATNLEAFKVLMEQNYVPENTIEIHAYAAEEIGLVGSGEMARQYKNENKKVVSMVQFDMNGYAANGPKVTFVSNNTNSSLNKQLAQLVDYYLEISSTQNFLLFGSSDHASWDKMGFPVAFPTEDTFNFNKKIHTGDDTVHGINSPEQVREFAKLSLAYLMHFGG